MGVSLLSFSTCIYAFVFFFNDTATTEIYTLSLHDALPISLTMVGQLLAAPGAAENGPIFRFAADVNADQRSEEHTSELQSRLHLVCRLLLEKKKKSTTIDVIPATTEGLQAADTAYADVPAC